MTTSQSQRGQKVLSGFLLGSLSMLLLACSTDNDTPLKYDANSTLNPAGPAEPDDTSLSVLDPSNPVNWLNNGNAERGTSGWYPQGAGVTITQSTAQQRSGQYSILVQGRTDVWHAPVMPILNNLPTGQTYETSVWVRLADGQMPATLQLSMKVAAQNAQTQYSVLSQAEVSANGWSRLTGTFTHEPEGEVTELTLYIQSPNTTVSYFVDDISLEPLTNLVVNSGFENGVGPWRFQGPSVTLTQAAEQAYAGDYSLLVAGRSETWHAPVMDLQNLAVGQSYLASVWVRLAPSTEETNLQLSLRRKDVNEETPEYISLEQAAVTSNEWVNLSGTFTHTAEATYEGVFLYIESDGDGASASFYVDDLDLRITKLDYVINSDVETGIAGWYPFGANVALAHTNADAYSGNYSLHVSNRDANWQGASFGFNALAQGETYSFSCWVKMAQDNPESSLALMIKRVDDETGADGTYMQLNAQTVTTDNWVQLSGTYQHMPVGELTELTAYVNASIDTAEFLIDACAINPQTDSE